MFAESLKHWGRLQGEERGVETIAWELLRLKFSAPVNIT